MFDHVSIAYFEPFLLLVSVASPSQVPCGSQLVMGHLPFVGHALKSMTNLLSYLISVVMQFLGKQPAHCVHKVMNERFIFLTISLNVFLGSHKLKSVEKKKGHSRLDTWQ